MPARVVLAMTDHETADQIARALTMTGIEVVTFAASMLALQALEDAHTVQVLVTSIQFPPNTPNGVALARMALHKRPRMKALFIDDEKLAPHADQLGKFMAAPVQVDDAVQEIFRLLPERR